MRPAVLLLLALTLCCTGVRKNILTAAAPVDTPAAMLDTVVQIEVTITGKMLVTPANGDSDVVNTGWTGSGVVYDKTSGYREQVKSRILSATHVLQVPAVGAVEIEGLVPYKVESVAMTIHTFDGRTCNLTPLVLGDQEARDVGTAEADCDAGHVAPIAEKAPARGERVYVVGHPLSIGMDLITEGYVSGWYGKFLLISAPSAPGNSGGPVFYKGQVIGLLVRGAARAGYANISMATTLEEVHQRIAATDPLQ